MEDPIVVPRRAAHAAWYRRTPARADAAPATDTRSAGSLTGVPGEVATAAAHAASKLRLRSGRLGVTSALRGEGRSVVARGIAEAMAREHGRRTLLLELDFESPRLAREAGLPFGPGLCDVLVGSAGLSESTYAVDDLLVLLPAGKVGDRGPRLAGALLESGLLGELAGEFDIIVADLPPLLESTFGGALAGAFDNPGPVLVVRAHSTPVRQLREAASLLASDPVVFLNGCESRVPRWMRRLTGA